VDRVCAYIRKQKKKDRDEEISHQNTANSGAPLTIPLSRYWYKMCGGAGFSTEMDDKLTTIWKEMLIASSRYIPRICL
jgi:hypothetical protein